MLKLPLSNFPGETSVVRIGCAGWSIPREASTEFVSEGTHLERYARRLNCSEINSSFYRPHKKETWERWANSVPQGVQFSVKAPRAITHEAKLDSGVEAFDGFLQQISYLGDKLGPLLFQLPPSLEFDAPIAKRFLSRLRKKYSGGVVWEPRHPTWFDNAASDLLKDFKVSRVAADTACVPAASEPGGSAAVAYFRLHGSPRRYYSSYSDDFLNRLAEQLVELSSQGRVWCIFDNTASGSAIRNALDLTAKVRARQ